MKVIINTPYSYPLNKGKPISSRNIHPNSAIINFRAHNSSNKNSIVDPYEEYNRGLEWYVTKQEQQHLAYAFNNYEPEEIEKMVKKDPSLALLKNDVVSTNVGVNNAYTAYYSVADKIHSASEEEFNLLVKKLHKKQDLLLPGGLGASQAVRRLLNLDPATIPGNPCASISNLNMDNDIINFKYVGRLGIMHSVYNQKMDSVKLVVPKLSSTIDKHKDIEQNSFMQIAEKAELNHKYIDNMDSNLLKIYEQILWGKFWNKTIPGLGILKLLLKK